MTINDFENLFMFAGGLGMFLFGVHSGVLLLDRYRGEAGPGAGGFYPEKPGPEQVCGKRRRVRHVSSGLLL